MGRTIPHRRGLMAILVCALILQTGWVHAGHINGTIHLTTPENRTYNGDWVRILLTTAAVPMPAVPPLDNLAPLARYDRIVSAHMDFYVRYQQHLANPGYLAGSVLTTDTGRFKFVDVAPGDYFVVVTFPSTIGGYKVAWQVPVTVPETGDAPPVSLGWENMALPTQKR